MRYLTCEACRFKPSECERRQSVEAAVRAFNAFVTGESHMSALRFTCPDRLIGFDPGARVVVEEAIVSNEYAGYGEVRDRVDVEEVGGTVIGHKGDHVQLWLDGETSRGKRWIRLLPVPLRPEGAIGVKPTGKRADLKAAKLEMLRATEKWNGNPPAMISWCERCSDWVDDSTAELFDGLCPGCVGPLSPEDDATLKREPTP